MLRKTSVSLAMSEDVVDIMGTLLLWKAVAEWTASLLSTS
jgi:hypothetical protein